MVGKMSVSCVHGDTKRYPTVQANIVMPQGSFQMMVGAVPELPVPLLVGQDCPLESRPEEKWSEMAEDESEDNLSPAFAVGKPVNPESESEGPLEPKPTDPPTSHRGAL